jgi:hypothetical protein
VGETEPSRTPEIDWDDLLESLAPLDFVLLEQLYVVEASPVPLRLAQARLAYLNGHPRTVSRHAERLARLGLLAIVVSCEMSLNPMPRLQREVELLVRIWRLREARALQGRPRGPGESLLGSAP